MNNNVNNSSILLLIDHIIRNIDLPAFLENKIGCDLKWIETDHKAICCCPIHSEKIPSFRLTLIDGVWIYFCFGCHAKGNVIHFFMDYFKAHTKTEAVLQICEEWGIESTTDLIADSLLNVRKKVNTQNEMECAHIVVCNQCRMLLKKNYTKYNKWVADTYRAMNLALEEEDRDFISEIGMEAAKKLMEK